MSTINPALLVIIPFYQNEKGILRKAVKSALAQKGINALEIIIVDDGSPVAAEDELHDLLVQYPSKIKLIKQENEGPGAARNKGLDSVSKDAVYVAFLDSDDEWEDTHLKSALYALEKGYDIYFSNYQRLDRIQIDLLEKIKNLSGRSQLKKFDENIYEWVGDFFEILLKENIVGFSTIVYRYQKFKNIRFIEGLRNIPSFKTFYGEDLMFLLHLSKLTQSIVFTTHIELVRGAGVNISASGEWGTEKALAATSNLMVMYKSLFEIFDISVEQKRIINAHIKHQRYIFIASCCSAIFKRGSISLLVLSRQCRIDPLTLLLCPLNILTFFFKTSIKYLDKK